MTSTETLLPPHIILTPESIYAIQGDVYALEPFSGRVQRHYPIEGLPKLVITDEIFYMNVTSRNTVQAVRVSDGALLWHYSVDSPFATQASIFVGSDDGSLSALHRSNGTVRWSYQASGVRLSTPAVVHDVLYIGVNDGSVLALHVDDGTLLWRTPLNEKKITVAYTYRKRFGPDEDS